MGSEDFESVPELNKKIVQIFKDFLTKIAKLEELGSAGGKFLNGFQQGLEFLRRPPVNQSQLIENIIKANETKRVKAYVEAGWVKNHDRVQNMSKLQTCLLRLQDHLAQAKSILKELEQFIEDLSGELHTANRWLLPLSDHDLNHQLEEEQVSVYQEKASCNLKELEMTDYAALMAILYSMVKRDYQMQERIITSLNLKSSSGELDSYCLMWSLRPFIVDEMVHQAWKLI